MKIRAISFSHIIILLVLAFMAGAGIYICLCLNRPATTPHQPPPHAAAGHTASRHIRLPGAQPIVPLPGEYTADDHLWRIVNKTHPLTNPTYQPRNLQVVTVPSRHDKTVEERSLRSDVMPALERLFAAAKTAGHTLIVGSGFRSHQLQHRYYTQYVRMYGQAAAETFSSKPGHSEHQLGLAVDLATDTHHCYLEACFGETTAGTWLADHAHEYGFILRYPKDKPGITDFSYEPWHFRYVGRELAAALWQSGLTLEEAAPYLSHAAPPNHYPQQPTSSRKPQ